MLLTVPIISTISLSYVMSILIMRSDRSHQCDLGSISFHLSVWCWQVFLQSHLYRHAMLWLKFYNRQPVLYKSRHKNETLTFLNDSSWMCDLWYISIDANVESNRPLCVCVTRLKVRSVWVKVLLLLETIAWPFNTFIVHCTINKESFWSTQVIKPAHWTGEKVNCMHYIVYCLLIICICCERGVITAVNILHCIGS